MLEVLNLFVLFLSLLFYIVFYTKLLFRRVQELINKYRVMAYSIFKH